MAEVLDQEKQAEQTASTEQTATTEQKSAFSEAAAAPKKKKKNKKKTVRRIVALVIVAALLGGGFFAWKQFGPKKDNGEDEVLTEMVSRGSITTVVEGSGAAMPQNSKSVTLLAAGKVRDIYVSEGDFVTEGTPLFEIDSTEVEDSVLKARERVRDQERIISDRQKDLDKYLEEGVAGDARAEFGGILLTVEKQTVGEDISKKVKLAELADNSTMLLTLYFSYAYLDEIAVGQSATVSVPVTMAQLSGRVHAIHKVDYVTSEGGRMFEVVIAVDNPGTLTKDMGATATVSGKKGTVYPYAPGKLDYFRTAEIKTPLQGKLTWFDVRPYQRVEAGESIAHIQKDSEDHESKIRELTRNIDDAKKTMDDLKKSLEKEEKNLESLSALAPIDGTVLSLGIKVGEEAKAGTVAVNIADVTTMKIEAQIDEMYISFVKAGMPVDLKLGETEMVGTVDAVSLSAKSENGVARFPITILVDNEEGLLRSGAYIDYSFTASQSEDCLLVPIQCVKTAQTVDGKNCKVLYVQRSEPVENPVELAPETISPPEGFQPVYVEVGISDNRNVEIRSGVEEGEIVYAGVVETTSGGMGMMF